MRTGKVISIALLTIVFLAPLSPANASTFDQADGWYKWRVENHEGMGYSCCGRFSGDSSGELTIFVHSENGSPVRIRAVNSNCGKAPTETATDLGSLSPERSDELLLEIVQTNTIDMDVREEALFWLVHTGSDATFEYVDQLLSRG